MDVLRELPALVVLERFPVPVLATAEDGAILFANSAFADMLGYTAEQVLAASSTRSSTPCPRTNPWSTSCASTQTSSSN
jgi:PAS domain-containing protein